MRPGYVVCSFVFLLLGLASLSSSINLLVLRFMILSLEEDEEEFDLQDVTQNVHTLDDEVMAISGPALSRLYALRQPETVSVCSCTCYGSSSTNKRFLFGSKKKRKSKRQRALSTSVPLQRSAWQKLVRFVTFRWRSSSSEGSDENFYDEETQSISNYKRFAIKRNSM